MADAPDPVEVAAAAVCEAANADLIVFAGPTFGDLEIVLCDLIETHRRRDNVLLFIGTYGGDPHTAYRMARVVQSEFTHFTAVVDTACKSAGTLLVIGADQLVMSNRGELGPLDIQVSQPDEPKERASGLAPVQALKILREQVAETYISLFHELAACRGIPTKSAVTTAEAVTATLFSKLYQQLEPIRLGEYQRAMNIMTEYGQRLAAKPKSMKSDGIGRLVTSYPDHNFAIDRAEAENLFKEVRGPNQTERELLVLLRPLFADALDLNAKLPVLQYFSTPSDKDKGHDPTSTLTDEAASGDPVREPLAGGRPSQAVDHRPPEWISGGQNDNGPPATTR